MTTRKDRVMLPGGQSVPKGELDEAKRIRHAKAQDMTTRTVEHVLIDIEDQKRQLYHRLKVNDVTVLVDGTPEGDAAIGMTIDLVLAAPDLVAALKGCENYLRRRLQEAPTAETQWHEVAMARNLREQVKAALAKASA